VIKKEVKFFENPDFDPDYAKFFSKALCIQQTIERDFKEKLSPRQIDNLFLIPANEKLRAKLLKKVNNDNFARTN
jgi:hypothetical protein